MLAKRDVVIGIIAVVFIILLVCTGTGLFIYFKSKPKTRPRILGLSGKKLPKPKPEKKPEQPNHPNKIVFTSSRDGNSEIYIMNPDGSDQKRLTNNSDNDQEPDFSPDGLKIAFVRGSLHAEMTVYIINTDGTNEISIGKGRQPRWSPDSKSLVYAGIIIDGDTSGQGIWLVDSDGGNKRRIATEGLTPEWSPKSDKILFEISTDEGSGQLNLINLDGSLVRRFEQEVYAKTTGWSFSPDGSKVVFVTWGGGEKHLVYTNVVDGTMNYLVSGKNYIIDPRWSPDGRYIAYIIIDQQGSGSNLKVIDITTGQQLQITSFKNWGYDAYKWSPDGSKIVIGFDPEGRMEIDNIFVSNINGTMTQITNTNGDSSPDWR